MSDMQISTVRSALLEEFRHRASSASSLDILQKGVVEAMALALPHYSWTGFYMLDADEPQTLVLGPFVGDPTPHIRIPVTQGICGAAVATGRTVVVDNVNSDPRYLSCSVETKSEIVVPISAHGKIIGEIDVDSHSPAAFTEEDSAFLEAAAHIIGSYIEQHAS